MRQTALLTVWLGWLAAGPSGAAQPVTQAELLRRLIDLERLTLPPPPGERTGLFSSYDRRQSTVAEGRYVCWDANDDRGQFLRDAAEGWKVMAEVQGPGALTRFWCEGPTGDLRVLVDGTTAIDGPLAELFSGGIEPFGMPLSYQIPETGGAVSFFPIGFASSCRVLCRDFAGEYQIDYVAFAPGTAVETFRPRLSPGAEQALEEVAAAFRRGLSDKQLCAGQRLAPYAAQEDLKPGQKLELTIGGAGTIRAFLVSLTDRREPNELYALHNLILRVFWDGQAEPDIEVPLIAFFGSGYQRSPYKSLVMGTDLGTQMPGENENEGWFMYCYFPMPFRNGARIEIENANPDRATKVGVMPYLRVDRREPPAEALRFKARMHVENPCRTFDFPLLETGGAGRVVGCVLNVDCPRAEWWGEGDHKAWIDGEDFPSILGTSTAGYFGNVSGLRPFRVALHGATRVMSPGKSSVYRWHTADCIDFRTSIRLTLENWQYNRADDVYYGAVVYWYGQPGAPAAFERVTPQVLTLPGLRIPGAVEIEDNIVGENWGNLLKEKYAGGSELSGKLAAVVTTADPLPVDIPWAQPGRYRLKLRVVPGRSFGTVSVAYPDGTPIGTVEYSRQSGGQYTVGEITLQAGRTRVIVTCSSTTVLDCWIVEPLDR